MQRLDLTERQLLIGRLKAIAKKGRLPHGKPPFLFCRKMRWVHIETRAEFPIDIDPEASRQVSRLDVSYLGSTSADREPGGREEKDHFLTMDLQA